MKTSVVVALTAGLCLMLLDSARATDINACKGVGAPEKPPPSAINITQCDPPPCSLKRKTTIKAEFRFTPSENVPKLTNTVWAVTLGLPLPFIGVDNTNACPQIYTTDGEKAGCPLKAGVEYVYKNQFRVMEFYPRINALVHWALTGAGNKDYLCFEVPVKIF